MPETNVLDHVEEPTKPQTKVDEQSRPRSIVESARSVLNRFGSWLTENDRKPAVHEVPPPQNTEPEVRDTLDANLASFDESPINAMNPSRKAEKVAAARKAVIDYLRNPTPQAYKDLTTKILTGDEFDRLHRLMAAGITEADIDRVSQLTDEDFAAIDPHDPTQIPDFINPRSNLVTLSGEDANSAFYPHKQHETRDPHLTPHRLHRVNRPHHEAHPPQQRPERHAPVNNSPERNSRGPGRRVKSQGRHRANTVVRRGDYDGGSRHEAPKVLA